MKNERNSRLPMIGIKAKIVSVSEKMTKMEDGGGSYVALQWCSGRVCKRIWREKAIGQMRKKIQKG